MKMELVIRILSFGPMIEKLRAVKCSQLFFRDKDFFEG